MWTYVQRTGWFGRDNLLLVYCYSGKGEGKNNPDLQSVRYVGPIPVGRYTMQSPVDTEEHGPFVIWLTPDPTNDMLGRADFGIHGDKIGHPGEASQGCIIMPRSQREAAWNSGDHLIEVVSG